jgi:lysophospholipase L1-like esterase
VRLAVLLLTLLACGDDMPINDITDSSPPNFVSAGVPARVPTHQLRPRRLYVYGDSILNGSLATTPSLGCVELVRSVFPGVITNNSTSGRPLYLVANTPAKRAALLALVVANGATEMWIGLGINDYVLSGADQRTSLAEFTSVYPLTLDALHAGLPDLRIYVQSPIIYDGVDPNGIGETVQQYRDAAQAACVGRSWCTYVDGLPIMLVADLAVDNVHPINSGHAKLATAMLAALQ